MKQNKLLTGVATVFLISGGAQQIAAELWDSQGWNDGNYYTDYDDCCCDESRFTVFADYLYWSTNHTFPVGYNITTVEDTETGPSNTLITDVSESGNVIRPKQKWSSGVRIGLGWSNCDWDIRGVWTGLRNHTNRDFAFPSIFAVGQTDITSGFSSHHLHYNIADLEIGKMFQPACFIELRPFIGVRGLWIHQNNVVSFDELDVFGIPGGPTVDVDVPVQIASRHHLSGVGPRIGLDTVWGSQCGLNLLGNISASLLYSELKTRFESDTVTAVLGTVVDITETDFNLTDSFWQLVPNLQMFIGLGYRTDFACEKYHLDIYAGWESTFYWETSFIGNNQRGVGYQGLTAGLKFDF